MEGAINHISEYADGNIISDQRIVPEDGLNARLVTYKNYQSGRILRFVSNRFVYKADTIIQLYRYRWNIEVIFKRLKQNVELCYFFPGSSEGIKSRVWVALIANLIFTVIHRQLKEAEMFVTLVNVAANNMESYIGLIKIMQVRMLTEKERDPGIVQLDIFGSMHRGVFQTKGKSP